MVTVLQFARVYSSTTICHENVVTFLTRANLHGYKSSFGVSTVSGLVKKPHLADWFTTTLEATREKKNIL